MRLSCSLRLCLPAFLSVVAASGQDPILERIWEGVQGAQAAVTTACGTLTETRTSELFSRPRVFRGNFCAAGAVKFWLEYLEPEKIILRFNTDFLNVTTSRRTGFATEVIQVGQHVRRTEQYFSGENAIENLKRNFSIQAVESGDTYLLKLVPRSSRFAGRVNYVAVGLGRDNFLPRSIEIDGKSGVRSVFAIAITSKNTRLDEAIFHVYRP